MSVWDDPDIRAGGEFVKLEQPGDSVSGVIQAIRKHRFDDGSVAPQVLLVTDTGEERTLTAGQVRLKNELATQRPEAGDWIRVTLTQIEPRAGGKSLKHFTVEIRRGNGQPPPQQQGTIAPGFGPPPAAPPAAPAQPYPPQQQYAQPAAPPPAPQSYAPPQPPPGPPAPQPAPPQPAAGGQLTPEQQAALAALTPEQRAALGIQ